MPDASDPENEPVPPKPTDVEGASPPANANSEDVEKQIEQSVSRAVQDLGIPVPVEQGRKLAKVIATEVTEVAYQGPLPPPRYLNQFNEVVPGLAREIADSAWREQRHRHKWENNARFNDTFIQSGGLFLGWLLALCCVAGYFVLIYLHYSLLEAAPLLAAPILVTIRSMLPNRDQAKSSAEEDRPKD